MSTHTTTGLEIDLYHMDAAYIAWKSGATGRATFDLTTRRTPFGGGYMLVSGLELATEHIHNFRYTDDDLNWLKSVKPYDDDFLHMISRLQFSGDVLAMPEGEIAFAHEPMLRVEAPFVEALLLESGLLRTIGISTLFSTKAARIHLAAKGSSFSDFAFRRAHEPMWVTRSAYIAGVESTSYVAAAKALGMPMSGTIPHAIIQAFPDELTAFRYVAAAMPKYTLLIDTYDVDQGINNAIIAANEESASGSGHEMVGVRIDSGDLGAWAKLVKKRLLAANMPNVKIYVSGDLDEFVISDLIAQKAPVDGYGVGGNLGVGLGTVASGTVGGVIGAVYKLAWMEGQAGHEGRMKIAGSKSTWPGEKQVYRVGKFDHDVIGLDGEDAPANGRSLLVPWMKKGKLVAKQPSLSDARERAQQSMNDMPRKLRALTVEQPYDVRFSRGIKAIRKQIEAEHAG